MQFFVFHCSFYIINYRPLHLICPLAFVARLRIASPRSAAETYLPKTVRNRRRGFPGDTAADRGQPGRFGHLLEQETTLELPELGGGCRGPKCRRSAVPPWTTDTAHRTLDAWRGGAASEQLPQGPVNREYLQARQPIAMAHTQVSKGLGCRAVRRQNEAHARQIKDLWEISGFFTVTEDTTLVSRLRLRKIP